MSVRGRGAGGRLFSRAIEAAALVVVPAAMGASAAAGVEQTALLSMAAVVSALGMFFAGFEREAPRPRDIMPVAVLAALAVAGRILFAPFPSFKPTSAIAAMAGAAFGRRAGFMTGALAGLVSNFFFGQGPWTPWQMYAWGLVGYLGGIVAATGVFDGALAPMKARRGAVFALVAFGVASGYLYGLVLNVWSIVGFYHPQSVVQALAVYAAALPFDTVHGIATALFLAVLYRPWMRKLRRLKEKYRLQEGAWRANGRE